MALPYLMTEAQLAEFISSASVARRFIGPLREHLPAAGIDTTGEVCDFMANVALETKGLTDLEESLNYTTPEVLYRTFRRRFKDVKEAAAYIALKDTKARESAGYLSLKSPADREAYLKKADREFRERAIANKVYANRLGNGNPESGEGWLYRGRGAFHTTGKDNYRTTSARVYGDPLLLIRKPELLETPEGAVRSAVWYWQWRGLPALSAKGDFKAICIAINGGLNGYDDKDRRDLDSRVDWRLRAERIFKA